MEQSLKEKRNIFKRSLLKDTPRNFKTDFEKWRILGDILETEKKEVDEILEDVKKREEDLKKKRFGDLYITLEELLKGSSFLDNATEKLAATLKSKKEQKPNQEGIKPTNATENNVMLLKIFSFLIVLKDLIQMVIDSSKNIGKLEKDLKAFKKYIKGHEKLLDLTPGFEPRRIEYTPVEK